MRKVALLALIFAFIAVTGCARRTAQATPTATVSAKVEPATTSTTAPTLTPLATAVPSATPTLVPITLPTAETPSAAELRRKASDSVAIAFTKLALPDVPNAASVNAEAIPMDRFKEYMWLRLYSITAQNDVDWSDAQYQSYLPDIAKEVLEIRIQSQLMAQEAKRLGITLKDADVAQYRTQLMSQIEAAEEIDGDEALLKAYGVSIQTIDDIVRDALTAQALIAQQGNPADEEQVRARHILVATEDEATSVLARLKAGEDFAAVAKEVSTDKGSSTNGGELGWFPRGAMVAAFEDAAFALNPGEMSGIVQSDYGYHIILVEEKAVRPLDSVYAEQRKQQAFEQRLSELEKQAKVERFVLND